MLCKLFNPWLVESLDAELTDSEDQLSISDTLANHLSIPKALYTSNLEPQEKYESKNLKLKKKKKKELEMYLPNANLSIPQINK